MTWHLETERLRLRPMEPGDLDAFHAVVSDPVSMRFYPKPFDREAARLWIERVRQRYDDHGFGLLAVIEKTAGQMIGDCGPMLMPVDRDEHVELGWHIRGDRQGQGCATEAGAACREHAWSVPGWSTSCGPVNVRERSGAA